MVEVEQNLGDINGQNGFVLVGLERGQRLGFSVSIIGDISGDGIDDIAFGAIDDGRSGAAHIVFGRQGSFPTSLFPTDLNGSNGFTLRSNQTGRLGFSVSGAGDINGDGIADLIVGAPAANPQGEFDISGQSYVIFGRSQGFPALVDVDQLNGAAGFAIAGAVGDRTGASASAAGDVNGDRIQDFIIGAPDNNRAYLVFGQQGQQPNSLDLTNLGSGGVVLTGRTDDFAGTTVRNIGDFNGDGFGDVAIAAPLARRDGTPVEQTARQEGRVYVVYGGPSLASSIDLTQLNGSNGFIFQGNGNGSALVGSSVDGAGDFNGDGLADVIIGARGAVNQGGGQAYVLYGQRSPLPALVDRSILNGQTGIILDGKPDPGGFVSRGDQAGTAVSGIGDYNQDGFDDVVVYAPQGDANGLSNVGRSFVVYGRASGGVAALELDNLSASDGFVLNGISEFDGDGLGLVQQDGSSGRVDGGGDLNGDGVPDLVIGNPVADRGSLQPSSGFGYAVFSPFAPSNTPHPNLPAPTPNPAPNPNSSTPTTAAPPIPTPPIATPAPGPTPSPAPNPPQTPNTPPAPPVPPIPQRPVATNGDDFLIGVPGGDSLNGLGGNDTLVGNTGDDRLAGNLGNDLLLGAAGDDFIQDSAGNDLLWGGAGNDTLADADGNNGLAGEDGDDVLASGGGNDQLLGGAGNDSLASGFGHDRLRGDAGDDFLFGDRGNDLLLGNSGQDTLLGDRGNDQLAGGAGDDVLWGGADDDLLVGGAGNDVFVLAPGQGRDIIFDFNTDKDRIALVEIQPSELRFVGNTIRLEDTTLAVFRKVFNLTAINFIPVP
ncbi:MAG: hypothetical protein AAF685_04270 [Cyanobacteria bacterium P01_C01_bin.89]